LWGTTSWEQREEQIEYTVSEQNGLSAPPIPAWHTPGHASALIAPARYVGLSVWLSGYLAVWLSILLLLLLLPPLLLRS
jgi:hypothetical protein